MQLFSGITLSIMCIIYVYAAIVEIVKNGHVYDLAVKCLCNFSTGYGAYVCFMK